MTHSIIRDTIIDKLWEVLALRLYKIKNMTGIRYAKLQIPIDRWQGGEDILGNWQ